MSKVSLSVLARIGAVLLVAGVLGSPAEGAVAGLGPRTCGSDWTTVRSPNPGAIGGGLTAVSADSATDAWAVGFYGFAHPMTLHWDGTRWRLVPVVQHRDHAIHLTGVSAISPTDVWAAGYVQDGVVDSTLAEHWDGAVWSIVPTPNLPGTNNFLEGISATGPDDVWAVGYAQDPGTQNDQPLAEHWNGSTWSIVPTADAGLSGFSAVHALSPDEAWAVGWTSISPRIVTLIERWDGSSWTVVPSPNRPVRESQLMGVHAVSSTDAWAVGQAARVNSHDMNPITLHWDGASWTRVPAPSGDNFGRLFGVVADPSGAVWGAGGNWSTYPASSPHTLIERWDGSSWTVVPSPNPTEFYDDLYSIAGASGHLWAVGTSITPGQKAHTLIVEACV